MEKKSCLGPACDATRLAKAHLLPAGFARGLHRPGGHNVLVDEAGGRRACQQLGWFDSGILCADCDRILGRLDEDAIALCRRHPPPSRRWTIDTMGHVDGDRLAAFATSVLWRVSASTLIKTSGVSLGVLANRARDASFGLAEVRPLPVIANRYFSDDQDPRDFQMLPIRFRLAGLNAYALPIGGFQLIVIADGRHRPPSRRHSTASSSMAVRASGPWPSGWRMRRSTSRCARRPGVPDDASDTPS